MNLKQIRPLWTSRAVFRSASVVTVAIAAGVLANNSTAIAQTESNYTCFLIDDLGNVTNLESLCQEPQVTAATTGTGDATQAFLDAFTANASPDSLAFAQLLGNENLVALGISVCEFLGTGATSGDLAIAFSATNLPPVFVSEVSTAALSSLCPVGQPTTAFTDQTRPRITGQPATGLTEAQTGEDGSGTLVSPFTGQPIQQTPDGRLEIPINPVTGAPINPLTGEPLTPGSFPINPTTSQPADPTPGVTPAPAPGAPSVDPLSPLTPTVPSFAPPVPEGLTQPTIPFDSTTPPNIPTVQPPSPLNQPGVQPPSPLNQPGVQAPSPLNQPGVQSPGSLTPASP